MLGFAMAKTGKKTRVSKSIISGYLEKIGQKVFTNHRSVITELIKGNQGIYALYKNDRLYYVGLASNLKNRINHHLSDKHKGQWTHFSLYIIRQEDHIKEIESLLLRIAYPKGNSVRGKLKSKDLRPLLKSRLKEELIKQLDDIVGGRKRKTIRKARAEDTAARKKRGSKEPPMKGLLKGYQRIYGIYKNETHRAKVLPSGVIELIPGKDRYDSPSSAGKAIRQKSTNGWKFWKYKNENGELVPIDNLRIL
jgi:hypothetical protein